MLRGEAMNKHERRLQRQLAQLGHTSPLVKRIIEFLVQEHLRPLRIPLGVLLVLGGLLGFLPILGFWMVPLGLLLLALDIPAQRPSVAGCLVSGRRLLRRWRSRLRLG